MSIAAEVAEMFKRYIDTMYERDTLRAENKRLREALEKIAYPVDENAQQVALEALERGK